MSFKVFVIMPIFSFTLVSINLIASDPGKAMFEVEAEKEKNQLKLTISKDQEELEEARIIGEDSKLCPMPVRKESPIGILQDEILAYIFSFLHIDDLGRLASISHRWSKVCSKPQLWRKVGLENYGDYLSTADLEEKPKEKVIQHYLSVRLNILDTEEEASVSKKFKEKYDLSSFTPYFKVYLPLAVKNGAEFFNAKAYGKFEVTQDIETKKEIEKLRRERDGFIQLAESEATEKVVANPYYHWDQTTYYYGSGGPPSYARNPTVTASAPNKTRLESAREINEKLIALGDESAAQKKKEQLTTPYSEYAALKNLYRGYRGDWDNFVKSSVDELCAKGYLFAFEWKVEWLVGRNEDRTEFIENMLQNENPAIRNMGHYLRVFGLKQGKLGYKKNQEEAVQYIRLYNVPY